MTAREGLFRAVSIIAVVSIISKLFGFIREASLAALFGATYATDAYLVGLTVPSLVFASLGAALGTTFIPVFSQVRQAHGSEVAFHMANSVINATMILALGFIAVGELLAGPLVRVVAPGFHGEVYTLTVEMSRIMFPIMLFQALAGIFTGMLQADNNFTVPAVVGLAFNGFVIASILVLGPRFGIQAVGVGTVAAVTAQVALQMPVLRRLGYRWEPVLDLHDSGLLRTGKMVGPMLVATAVGQMNTVVDRVLASGLEEGSIAALNYANRLMGLAPGVFGVAVTTVMYPTLARLAAARDWRRFVTVFAGSVKIITFIMIPVAVGMAVLRAPLVQLAFGRGAFDHRAAEATAWALLFFCLGVAVFTLRDMIGQAFFALQDTTTPMIIGTISVGINILLNLLLVEPLRQGGLALATSLAGVFSVATLLWRFRWRMRVISGSGIGGRALLSSFWRVMATSGIMGVVVWVVYAQLEAYIPGGGVITQSIRLLGATGAGVVTYAAAVFMLRIPEARFILDVGTTVLHRYGYRLKSPGGKFPGEYTNP